MSHRSIQVSIAPSEEGSRRSRTSGCALKTHVPLPIEILQQVIQSDELVARDVLCLRGVSQQWKAAVDSAILPHLRVPTTSLIGEQPWPPKAVAAFIETTSGLHARKPLEKIWHRTLSIGARSSFIYAQDQTLLVRCENGRIIRGDVNSSFSVFSEVAKSNSIGQAETLLATIHLPGENLSWRLLTKSSQSNEVALYCLRGDEQWRRLLPRPDLFTVRQAHDGLLPGQVPRYQSVFSSCGTFLVERFGCFVTRYRLDGQNKAIHVDMRVQDAQGTVTLCPQTGRRFHLQVNADAPPKVVIFSGGLSEEIEQELILNRDANPERWISISPDGRRFAIERLYLPALPESAYTYFDTYEIEGKEQTSVLPLSSQTHPFDSPSRHGSAAWYTSEKSDWTFEGRPFVCTTSYEADARWRPGMESSQNMTALVLSDTWDRSLQFFSKLPMKGTFTKRSTTSERPQEWWFLDLLMSRRIADSRLPFADAFLPKRGSTSRRQVEMFARAVALPLVFPFAAGLLLYRASLGQYFTEPQDTQQELGPLDLQTAELPASH